MRVEVRDDGRGIPNGQADRAPSHGHIGLASCRERAESVGWQLEIVSAAGQGRQ